MVRVTQNPTTAKCPDLVGNMAKPLLLWTNFKVQRCRVCPVWEFSEETVTPSGYILDGSILSLTLSLPKLASELQWPAHTQNLVQTLCWLT